MGNTSTSNRIDTQITNSQIPVLSLDSGIEEIFYNKCMEKETLIPVLMEWANSKPIYCKYTSMISSQYGNYSLHDSSHSVSILEAILAVIGKEKIALLEVMDLWLLLHCAYAHDIGMPYSYDQAIDLWKQIDEKGEFASFINECMEDEDGDIRKAARYLNEISNRIDVSLTNEKNIAQMKEHFSSDWPIRCNRYSTYLTSEYCRRNHAKRAEEHLNKRTDLRSLSFQIESRFYKYVATCSKLHGEDFSEIFHIYKREWCSYGTCHPAFIAALLRIGDLLDIDNNRFDCIILENYGALPQISQIHKLKHESVEHIYYARGTIEITARSMDKDVCKCLNDWFAYLKSDVQQVIFHWGELAPESFGGCEFSLPDLKVYYNNELFRSMVDHEFQVNKNMLIDLVIGRNLYNSKLDFIREYLQNSLDASKMKLWIELNDEANLHYINNDHLEQWKKQKAKGVLPFSLSSFVYQHLQTDIVCEWVDKKHPCIRITISDRGIGIDEECVNAISHIGSGWKKRKKYKSYLSNMPAWLQPTGGFGIGMQSGFMIADRIDIYTKCEGERKGRNIRLMSSAKDGKIEESENNWPYKGTSISIEIPYEWFLDEQNFNYYRLTQGIDLADSFSPSEITVCVTQMIKNYVQETAGNSLFPIRIKWPGAQPYLIQNEIEEESLKRDSILIDNQEYKIYYNSELIYIWESKEQVLFKIEPGVDFDYAELFWYYKGIRVWQELSSDNSRYRTVIKAIGKISVDIMGVEVTKCLTVDRNKFAIEYDYTKLLDIVIRVFFNLDNAVGYLYKDTWWSENLINYKDCYRIMLLYLFSEKGESKSKVKKLLDLVQKDDVRYLGTKSLLLKTFVKDNKITDEEKGGGVEKGKTILDNSMLLPYFCRLLYNEQMGLKTIFCEEKKEIRNTNNSKEIELNSYTIIYDAQVCDILQPLFTEKFEWEGLKCYRVNPNVKEDTEEKEKVFASALNCSTRQIFYTNKYYPVLFVSRIPFANNIQKILSEDEKGKHMIISPINPMDSDSALLEKRFERSADPLESFTDFIVNDQSFAYLVEWVYKYQIEPEKYDRDKIIKQYKELIGYIFDSQINISNKTPLY